MQRFNEQIALLELEMDFMGRESIIHPLFIADQYHTLLIDAGLPGQYEQLTCELHAAGTCPQLLDDVLFTHQDLDHIGCLPELDAANPTATFYAHEWDAPYIRGERPLLKDNVVPWQSQLTVLPSGRVDRYLTHGQHFPIAGGIEVIHTPGHTSGHVCLLLSRERAVIAGDIVFYIDAELVLPPVALTENLPAAMQSLEQLLAYDFDTLICYHGGVCYDAKARLRRLLQKSFWQ
ncbi:MBL fold metallo-hydrolase [Paenibacillus campi]|uniref:MBL fold metallo-hydrolase n=1 Tax=Paenibacillus campi TaxID=3106031 RepID=UPI002B001688|nr:MBL fold metallo-hydrolase [Paenibacillus sp. SGZ-1009]